MRVGLLSPGHMGSALGRRLREHGATVTTCVVDRSDRTRGLARDAGLELVPDLPSLIDLADLVLSVVVPAQAPAVAEEVALAIEQVRPDRLVVADLNAVAPRTTRRMGGRLEGVGATFVDGAILGQPPAGDRTPRIVVSGSDTTGVQALGEYGLDIRHVAGTVGSASALKMSFGAFTKGTTALATQLLVAAARHDVVGPLLDELAGRQPALLEVASRAVPAMPTRARRWVGEMEEIDAAFIDAGLPPGTFAGIADLYRWVGEHPLADEAPETRVERDLREVIEQLARDRPDDAPPA